MNNDLQSIKGYFISFEGGEGCGKSTQAALLEQRFIKSGTPTILVREPGSTLISEAIRQITHNPQNAGICNEAEALLFASARAQGVREIYLPALNAGKLLIADRFVDSSYVYQGYGRKLGFEAVKMINDFATNGLLPNLTFWLDLDQNISHQRRLNSQKIDRMDLQSKDFYELVNHGYRQLAELYPDRIVRIDASGSVEAIHELIWDICRQNNIPGTS